MADYNYEIDLYDDEPQYAEQTTVVKESVTQDKTEEPVNNLSSEVKEEKQQQNLNPAVIQPQATELKQPGDPNAFPAMIMGEMPWWTSDDEVRGWTAKAGHEADLLDVTFAEHKVNGKSKGSVYLEFKSPEACAACRKYIMEHEAPHMLAGFEANYVPPGSNPFKSLPKDPPPRNTREFGGAQGHRGGFRGGMRGNYNNFQRGGGFMPPNPPPPQMMGGFNNNMNMPMNPQFGFQGRGGMPMMTRGGRGGRGGMDMPFNPMAFPPMPGGFPPRFGQMPFNMPPNMSPGMPPNPIPGGMPGGMPGNGIQGLSGSNSPSSDQQDNNPHGMKRPRQ